MTPMHPVHDDETARPPLTIDCDECVMQHTSACDDCVVTFLVDRDERDAVVFDWQAARAVRLLAGAGLVPGLRHSPR